MQPGRVSAEQQQDPQGLIEALRADCQEQVRAIRAAAEREQAELTRQHEQACQAARQSAEAEGDARISDEVSRIRNRLLIERKKRHLQLEDAFVQEMIAASLARLRADLQNRYRQWLQEGAAAVLAAAGDGPVQLLVAAPDVEVLASWLQQQSAAANTTLSAAADVRSGGVIACNQQTGTRSVLTLDRILYRCQGRIRRAVVAALRNAGWHPDS